MRHKCICLWNISRENWTSNPDCVITLLKSLSYNTSSKNILWIVILILDTMVFCDRGSQNKSSKGPEANGTCTVCCKVSSVCKQNGRLRRGWVFWTWLLSTLPVILRGLNLTQPPEISVVAVVCLPFIALTEGLLMISCLSSITDIPASVVLFFSMLVG